jgi:hypothetical protein
MPHWASLVLVEVVPKFDLLGADIALVFLTHRNRQRDPLAHRNAVFRQSVKLLRIVTHQPHRGDFQRTQNAGGRIVFARIVGQAEIEIGLDRIAPLLLQRPS